MNYKKTILPNKLRVITVPMPSLESATLMVWSKVGSRYEPESIAGLSHFLEHMVFKGSKKRPSAAAIAEAVDGIGGEFNAGTSKEWTNFYIKTQVDRLETAFDVLSDMVLNPILKEADLAREKGVILEEMAMYEDTPMANIPDVFEQLIFDGSYLGRDTIGTADAVKAVKKDDFVSFRSTYYYPENMLILISGGITEKKALDSTRKYFSKLKSQTAGEAGFSEYKADQVKPRFKLKSKKVEQAHFILGFRGNNLGHPDRYVEAVLATILGGGMSSRLFSEIREKRGLAYAVRTSTEHYIDTGYIGTYSGVDVKKAKEAVKITLDEHYKLASGKKKITKEELRKAKEYVKGHLALYLEDTKSVSYFFGEQELLLGQINTPEEMFAEIEKVEIEDVVRVAKEFFVPSRLNLAVIGPYNSSEEFEKLLK